MVSRRWLSLSACLTVSLGLAACVSTGDPVGLPTPATLPQASHGGPTILTAAAADPMAPPSPTLTPLPTPTMHPVDYATLIDAIRQYVKSAEIGPRFDLALGFVDVQTGQTASFDGNSKHLSLSTFKGPLGAYYVWLVERGAIRPQAGDAEQLVAMMNESDNAATSCVFKRVGGLAGFNDWLALQGLARENNFIASWQSWGCSENGITTILPIDPRYSSGDQALNLPGNYTLERCAPRRQLCPEAFAPVELAQLYARLYRGEVLDASGTAQWLEWMVKKRENVALLGALPPYAPARAFVKNGFSASDDNDPLNYYDEAGIIETPYGVYAVAVFTQGNPDWPGTDPIKAVGKIVYSYFADAYRGR